MTGAAPRRWGFWVAALIVIGVIAGGVSAFASTSPDGLDAATQQGCEVVHFADGTEGLRGECIAQHARAHDLADSPLAGYAVDGRAQTSWLAGLTGAAATVLLAGGVCWLITRTPAKPVPPAAGD